MNKVISVVVTYNRMEMLKQCISAIQNQSYPCDILVVNNASTDNTEEWIREYIKTSDNIHYINTGENIGGAGGFNKGMRWGVENGYEYVWIMDDDCIANTDSLDKLMQADEKLNGEYGYLSSVVLWTDGQECKMNRQKYNNRIVTIGNCDSNTLARVQQSTFVSLLFMSKTIKNVGLPIKEFFIWGDDIEYTRRITVRSNLPSYMVGSSTVVHTMKENTGSSIATDSVERINRYNFAYRNENYLYRKEGIKGVAYYLAKCGLNIIRILIKANNHRIRRICAILKNMVMGMWFNPTVEYIEGFENGKQQRVIN